MHPSVTSVTPLENYLLSVEFANGEQGILDMKPYLDFGVFKRLKERSSFNQVRVSFDTIEWSVGVDLDPAFVYSKCQRSTAQQDVAEA
ncbi:DUF2442 domain-containing protein [Nitrincola sp.]|uniref:DUF2442 domain-containing protein n=1 Tax=Nitrincola sp. TaxID=1926584 RepID=UPI003A94746C